MAKAVTKTGATKSPPAPPSGSPEVGALVRVRSKGERFRRAGIEFTRDGVDIDVATLTADQVAAINAEPSLIVDGGEIAQ